MSFVCEYCNTSFITNYNLLYHQKTAKYCLSIRGNEKVYSFECSNCGKKMTEKRQLKKHEAKCESSIQDQNRDLEKQIQYFETNEILLKETIKSLEYEVKESKTIEKLLREKIHEQARQIQDLQNKLENIAIKGATKSTSTNILNILQPLVQEELNETGRNITIEDIKGAKRLAQFAADNSLKGKVITSDASRCVLKYKKPNGEIVRDKNGIKITKMFCKSIEEPVKRHYDTVIQNINTETDDFKEIDATVTTYKGIKKLANGEKDDLGDEFICHLSKLVPDKEPGSESQLV